jgi:hypothetical protein
MRKLVIWARKKQSQNKANSNPIKANFGVKQSQLKPKQTQF